MPLELFIGDNEIGHGGIIARFDIPCGDGIRVAFNPSEKIQLILC